MLYTPYQSLQPKCILFSEELCVSLEDLEKGVKNDDLLLIDVRRQDEVDAGRIPAKRFIHVPLDQVGECKK